MVTTGIAIAWVVGNDITGIGYVLYHFEVLLVEGLL